MKMRVPSNPWQRNTARLVISLWAVFWGYFVLAHAFEGDPAATVPVLSGLFAIGFLAWLTWRWMLAGSIACVLAAVASAIYFDNASARLLLSLPLLLVGLLSYAAWRRQRSSSAS